MNVFQVISEWLKATLLPYGGIGLMLLAVADSSFLSLPEVNDVLLVTFSIDNPRGMILYASLTTVGSLIGCALLYSVGRKGGEAFLRSRFHGESIERVQRWYRKYGLLAIIVPSVLPPPTPFKIFVLAAGAFGVSWPQFILAVVVGRGLRYFSEGLLAVRYGAAAITFIQQHYWKLGLAVAILFVVSAVIFYRARVRRFGLALMFAATLVSQTACLSRKRVLTQDELPLPSKSASREELLTLLRDQSAAVRTLLGTVLLEASGGAMSTGVLTEYREMKGFLLVERPDRIRLRTQAPLALATIFDVVSEHNLFRMSIPIQNKFIVGNDLEGASEKNPILNLRPRHILQALFLDAARFLDDSRFVHSLEEVHVGRYRYYVVSFLEMKGGLAALVEKIWIDRSAMIVARKQIFGSDGVVETDVNYSGYQPVEGGQFPGLIVIQRPVEDYTLRLTFLRTQLNTQHVENAFLLEQPAGSELVQVEAAKK